MLLELNYRKRRNVDENEVSKIARRGELHFLFLKEFRGWHAGSVMDAAGAEPSENCIETARLRR